jgi:hypothetical protein
VGETRTTIERNAFHKAGHTIVSLYFGIPVFKVTITSEKLGGKLYKTGVVDSLSWSELYKLRHKISIKKLMWRFLVCAAAGWQAEKMHNPYLRDEMTVELGRGVRVRISDVEILSANSSLLSIPEHEKFYEKLSLTKVKKKAKIILRGYWGYTRVIADALLERGSLMEDDIKKIVPDLYAQVEKKNSVKNLWKIEAIPKREENRNLKLPI